jgi:hypothetical protein
MLELTTSSKNGNTGSCSSDSDVASVIDINFISSHKPTLAAGEVSLLSASCHMHNARLRRSHKGPSHMV